MSTSANGNGNGGAGMLIATTKTTLGVLITSVGLSVCGVLWLQARFSSIDYGIVSIKDRIAMIENQGSRSFMSWLYNFKEVNRGAKVGDELIIPDAEK